MRNKDCLTESRSAGAQSSTFQEKEGEESAIVLHCQVQEIVLLALMTSHGQKTLLAHKAGQCQMQVSALGMLEHPMCS